MVISMKNINVFVVLSVYVFMVGCGIFNNDTELKVRQFDLINLDYENLYYTYSLSYYQIYDAFEYNQDDSGVAISLLPHGGTDYYYNPTDVGFRGTNLFDGFMNVHDSLYLDYALRHRDKLIELMDDKGYLEYRIEYQHFDKIYSNPWYSGIAQGQALSFFSRLAYYAQDSLSGAMAHKVYETVNPYNPICELVVNFDKDYAWIEEYPDDPPDHTFGGFMRAIIGLYDYYHLLKNNDQTAKVLSIYLTTVEDNMYRFRNPGGVYYYDLKYKQSYTIYQKIVVQELNFLTKITQDSCFAIFADTLKADYWEW